MDYAVFGGDETLALLMDVVALAHRDGVFHPAEKLFVRTTAARLGVDERDIEALLG